MKKSTKSKGGSKIISGLLIGAAAGVLTFLFVKPKVATRKKEDISNNLNIEENEKLNPENLFI
ncbi:hypothetical protein [Reichenbachiella sp. MALMAid0571]|uniref:hypothetical protein n=1 Tax=Reichenbachiella sp. MALMAid0571 TaxID=3143939 RepID=UPI0032DF4B13